MLPGSRFWVLAAGVTLVASQIACGSANKPPSASASAGSTSVGGAGPGADAAPVAKHAPGVNPFTAAKWWVDPYGQAHLRSLRARKTDPEVAALLDKIARNGGADWIGEWTPNIENWVSKRITLLQKNGALPFFVAYNIPHRDCGLYSAGGAVKSQDYRDWIQAIARGIGNRKAVVVLEPDALPSLTKCLTPAEQKERTELVNFAIHTIESRPLAWVYVDAGHSAWIAAPEMAKRLKAAGVDEADGFAINVSNYQATDDSLDYGRQLSRLLGGKHFVIDTGRNGNGPPKADRDSEAAWCNPDGRALGSPPTTDTGEPACDAFLWIKKPGESDGQCNGGPKAGVWWQEYALGLAKRAKW